MFGYLQLVSSSLTLAPLILVIKLTFNSTCQTSEVIKKNLTKIGIIIFQELFQNFVRLEKSYFFQESPEIYRKLNRSDDKS